ncbi:hypothetical protein [Bradyrhizobium sp. CCBAU 21360]|uniref:hypothetical protein n=1 Tax=Bradyrhizobium sp. CCBAU 21360 TaxID=1325081 RepID=UPI002305D2E9|nr:hypothetical protein [Bradyrhizobium sp. CCBAU 21360]MDA9446084.1 hypothetical protein [Bradyrhizobium sp. CCBAU 21360]
MILISPAFVDDKEPPPLAFGNSVGKIVFFMQRQCSFIETLSADEEDRERWLQGRRWGPALPKATLLSA